MRLLRRLFASLNVLVIIVLLGMLFIMINYIASRRYARWDLTQQKITALSDQTRQTLKTLTEPVSVIVFYQPGHRLYDLVTDLLDEYARHGSLITVERVDPDRDLARSLELLKRFQIDAANPENLNLVIFEVAPATGGVQAATRHKYLSDTDLAEYDYATMTMTAEPRVKTFKGEEAFTSTLISLTRGEPPLVWFVTGHGEKALDLTDPLGLSELKRALEQQHITAQSVTLLERAAIPMEVKLVVIAGATSRYTDAELTLLQAHLQQGGRLLALIDPLDDTGLDGLLEQWGIVLGHDIVVDPDRQLQGVSAGNLFVTTYTQHPIVGQMKRLMTLYPLARSVRPAQPLPAGLTVTPLVLTSEAGWGETNTRVEQFVFHEGPDLPGPVSIAVAAERLPAPPTAPGQRPPEGTPTRLVVIGDSDFLVNIQLDNLSNRSLVLGAINWLLQQERYIGIAPKSVAAIKLSLTHQQFGTILLFSFLVLPLGCGLVGTAVWWIRRR